MKFLINRDHDGYVQLLRDGEHICRFNIKGQTSAYYGTEEEINTAKILAEGLIERSMLEEKHSIEIDIDGM